MLREEVEEAVHSIKVGKCPGVDNISSELLENGGEATPMPEDLRDKRMTQGADKIARRTFSKERQHQAMSELSYRQLKQTSQQDHASSYPQPTQGQG